MGYDHVLLDEEKRELLRIARATVREFTRTGYVPPGKPHRQVLCDEASVFVTLHRDGELRGCIGSLQDNTPLYKAVQEMAVAAATRDTRFEPIPEEEVADLEIEISVLGGRKQISAASEIELGTHGLCITKGLVRGLLLPQVAVEHKWDAATFLERVCAKAGLPENAWKDPAATVEVFTAQVFDESQHPPK